jgi:hypothetical protein
VSGTVLRLAALGVMLPVGFVVLIWAFRSNGDLRTVISLLLLISSPPWPLLAALLPGLLEVRALFLAAAILLNGLLFAGVGAWLVSSQGRPAVLRYGPIVATWIVLLGIARTFTG